MLSALFVVVVGGCSDDGGGQRSGSDGSDGRPGSSAATEETQAAVEPTCEEIEAFAATLTDTGITYDYSATSSPAALAERVDVVFGATLTGAVGQVRSDDHQEHVAYEADVTRVVLGSDLVSVGDRVDVLVAINPSYEAEDRYADATRPGIEAAIFGYQIDSADGWHTSLEGFTVACDGGPLIGWTGFLGGWEGLTSVDEVLDAAA